MQPTDIQTELLALLTRLADYAGAGPLGGLCCCGNDPCQADCPVQAARAAVAAFRAKPAPHAWKVESDTRIVLVRDGETIASVEQSPADSLFYIAQAGGEQITTNLPFEAMGWAEDKCAAAEAQGKVQS
jgi:hypothetical protein